MPTAAALKGRHPHMECHWAKPVVPLKKQLKIFRGILRILLQSSPTWLNFIRMCCRKSPQRRMPEKKKKESGLIRIQGSPKSLMTFFPEKDRNLYRNRSLKKMTLQPGQHRVTYW